MILRRAFILSALVGVVSACTAVLGVEDVPVNVTPDASANTEGGVITPGTDSGPGADAGLDKTAEIAAYTLVYCNRYKACSGPDFDYNYKDLDECVASIRSGEDWAQPLPGITLSAQNYRDCAMATAALTCEEFGARTQIAACTFKGTKPTDAKCLSNGQCASGFCSSDDTTCRGCIVPPDKGAKCGPGDQCGSNLICISGTCVAEVGEGQACSADQPCGYPLQCLNSKCSPRLSTAGAACGGANGQCDSTKGLLCVSSKCTPITVSAPGAACGSNDAGYRICRRNAKCTDGTCSDFPKEGDPCDFANGPNCLFPLRCVSGKCAGLPASSTCE